MLKPFTKLTKNNKDQQPQNETNERNLSLIFALEVPQAFDRARLTDASFYQ